MYVGDNYKNYVEIHKSNPNDAIQRVFDEIRYNGGVAVTVTADIKETTRFLKFMFESEKRYNPFTGQTTPTRDQVSRAPNPELLPQEIQKLYPQFANIR